MITTPETGAADRALLVSKERPILFSAPMTRALLDGSKTQTRRIVKQLDHQEGAVTKTTAGAPMGACWAYGGPVIECPFGQPRMRLWVRETFIAYGRWETRYSAKKKRDEWHFVDMTIECDRAYQYSADNPDVPMAKGRGGALPGWYARPAIFMPRAACRILLEIVSVRVERLNDISEADATAEGVGEWVRGACAAGNPIGYTDIGYYSLLWDQINGAGAWDANPSVWVVEFKRAAAAIGKAGA